MTEAAEGAGDRARSAPGPGGHAPHDDEAVGHRAVPPREARPAAAQPRRHRAAGGELHRLHAVRPRVPRLVHLHRRPQGDRHGRAGGGRARSATSSTASPSTSRCACTAASASRCARSTRCSGARSSSTPSSTSASCSTRRTGSAEWMYTVPPPPALEEGAEAPEEAAVVTAQEYAFLVVGRDRVARRHRGRDRAQRRARGAVPRGRAGLRSAITFLLVGAEFVGWAQVLIYVGAIVILFLFGLMLTKAPIGRDTLDHLPQNRIVGAVVALLIFVGLATLLLRVWPVGTTVASQPVGRQHRGDRRVDVPRLRAALRGRVVPAARRADRRDRARPQGRRRARRDPAAAGAAVRGAPVLRAASTACWRGATRSWC